MKKSLRSTGTMLTTGMFDTSSYESSSDDDKSRLLIADSMFSYHNDEQVLLKERLITKIPSIQSSVSNKINRRQTVKNIDQICYHESDDDSPENKLCHRSNFEDENVTLIKNDYHVCDDVRLEKTGWLNIKHWLTVQSHAHLQLATKTQWQRFWIWLKDSSLHLYNDYADINPNCTIDTIDCLCYPLPEYRHRQNVFSLTTNTGNTYYLQSSNQSEVDHWIYSIHSNCLFKLNINRLHANLKQLENDIIYEIKMLKLAQLQLKLSRNELTHSVISKQIERMEGNLELLQINLFRRKSYLSTLNRNQLLSNSTDLLSQISVTTKILLYDLDAFTPGGVYAYVIARTLLDRSRSRLRNPIETDQTVLQTILFGSNPQRKIVISMNKMATAKELLKRVVDKLSLAIDDYFLFCYSTTTDGFIPNQHDVLSTLVYSSIEVRRKITYQIILNNLLNPSGIEINHPYPTTVLVTNVHKGSEGERLGVIKGDEIMMINNSFVRDLDSIRFQRYLNQIPVTLTLRSSRLHRVIDISQTVGSKKSRTPILVQSNDEFNRSSQPTSNLFAVNNEQQQLSSIPLSNIQQIQRAIVELIETEISYVQDLQSLTKQYIEPLRNHATVLPSDAIESLFHSVQSIHQLQTRFLDDLQSNLLTKTILLSICETFIRTSKSFKLYSTYCAIHLRINRLLNLYQTNEYLRELLSSCNPYHQQSLSFQSYLIKPVQRILKYPLFLQQIFIYCNIEENNNQLLSKETSKLKQTIQIMNEINEYINSMQQLYEDFGQSFEYIIKNSKEQSNKIFELNLSELYAYGEINWINIYRFVSKRNYQDFKTFCFIFRTGCFLLVREQSNKKNQDSWLNTSLHKNTSDHFLRFLPIEEIQAEVINDDDKSHRHSWQMIQTDPKTQLKTCFHFANRDAQLFVKTINNCVSKVQWKADGCIDVRQSSKISSDQTGLLTSRSCHDFSPRYSSSIHTFSKNRSRTNWRSPSPIWRRRTISLRKQPLPIINNKKID